MKKSTIIILLISIILIFGIFYYLYSQVIIKENNKAKQNNITTEQKQTTNIESSGKKTKTKETDITKYIGDYSGMLTINPSIGNATAEVISNLEATIDENKNLSISFSDRGEIESGAAFIIKGTAISEISDPENFVANGNLSLTTNQNKNIVSTISFYGKIAGNKISGYVTYKDGDMEEKGEFTIVRQ